MVFNPPPNWPAPPPGWTPEPGWQPDPAWGPPPPGWQLELPAPPAYDPTQPSAADVAGDLLVANGYNGEMVLDEQGRTLAITRDGKLAKLAAAGHYSGARVIPLDAISGVHVHHATRLTNGYLAIGVGGKPAPSISMGQANGNRDAVMFRYGQKDAFLALGERLQAVIDDNLARGVDPAETGVEATGVRSEDWRERTTEGTRTKADDRAAKAQDKAQDKYDQRLDKALANYSADGSREDIAEAAARMSWTLGGRRELKKLHEHVHDDERVTFIAQGTYQTHQGIVVLTDQRLVFVFHGLVQAIVEDFPLRSITSVSTKKGLTQGTLIVHVAGAASHITSVVNADLSFLVEDLRQTVSAGPRTTSAAPAAAPAPDLADQLLKLANLRDLGILTDDEFAAQKAKLLG